MMSVNQMNIYHTLLETYNIVNNSSSELIKEKWENRNETKYSLRSDFRNNLKIPEKPKPKCTGLSYCGAKLMNMLPHHIKESENSNLFKTRIKKWVWQNIPSY